MSRRAPLPGAAELFRSTSPAPRREPPPDDDGWFDPAQKTSQPSTRQAQHSDPAARGRRGTGRQKHDSKITVYVSQDELLALEHARLALRATHGLVVDRGRVVREAIAVLLADLDASGEDSVLVRRLRLEHGQDDER
ncbi:hypothetical protein EV193_12031 [Herbihabitans rhizosphaerae]|uniref:Cobyrinic acid a,c-diamide synthase n=1 Tax=Herbihabitans rhizosphaerae TaxID=1872711 RepID=A0A4Q7KAW1_9PSEU|nr:cobyrinic acid a,c-diamide synthase [Herbihabitans rhizosphaerae]RZS29546.1 hypothetical protein EV193_12031 [Herbihabitans rhizosphaerae]